MKIVLFKNERGRLVLNRMTMLLLINMQTLCELVTICIVHMLRDCQLRIYYYETVIRIIFLNNIVDNKEAVIRKLETNELITY